MIKKNGTYWTNLFESREWPPTCLWQCWQWWIFVSPPSPAVDSVFVINRLFVHPCMNVQLQSKQWLCIWCIKERFIAKMLNGVMFLIWLNLPVKIHQNLMLGFHFYTLHGSKWLRKLLDLHSRLKYHSLRCISLHGWLPKRQYRCL